MQTTNRSTKGRGAGARGAQAAGKTEDAQSSAVRVPWVSAQLRWSKVRVPGGENVAEAVDRVREHLPSVGECAYFGGLVGLAALSLIEWPVAAAIGVGTVVAQRAGSAGTTPPRRSGV